MEKNSFTSRKDHLSQTNTTFLRKNHRPTKSQQTIYPIIPKIKKSRQPSEWIQPIQKSKKLAPFIPKLNSSTSRLITSKKFENFGIQQGQSLDRKVFMERTFRNTTTFANRTKREKHDFPKTKLKQIELIMKQKKQNFSWAVRQNFSKMNESYTNCFQGSIKDDITRSNQHRTSEQQNMSMKIQMQTKSKKSILLIGASFNEKRHNEKHAFEDLFIKENNLFSIEKESKKCYDGLFPMFRTGHTLCSVGTCVYLFGGINSRLVNDYHFNAFLGHNKEWICLKNQLNFSMLIPSFHSVQAFRNYLIFIGGSALNEKVTKRLYNQDIIIYDITKSEFSLIRWNISLRSHASTIYSNMLVIYGGIDENNIFSNILYFLPLNVNNISQTTSIPYNLGAQGEGIAHHKMVNTFDIEHSLKKKLTIDGIICYGGKFADGRLNSQLLLFKFNKNKQSTQTQKIIKGWQIVKPHGASPQPRYHHTMNILCKKCICLVVGGLNYEGQALSDVWILDLITSSWIKAMFDNKYDLLERGIFSHAATVMKEELFVFGGMNGNNQISNEFWSMDFCYIRAAKRQDQMKKSRTNIYSSQKLTKKAM